MSILFYTTLITWFSREKNQRSVYTNLIYFLSTTTVHIYHASRRMCNDPLSRARSPESPNPFPVRSSITSIRCKNTPDDCKHLQKRILVKNKCVFSPTPVNTNDGFSECENTFGMFSLMVYTSRTRTYVWHYVYAMYVFNISQQLLKLTYLSRLHN